MASAAKPNMAHPSSYPPSKTALLLLDYHNFIVDMCPDPQVRDSYLSAASSLQSAARASGAPILHCLVDVSARPGPTSKMQDRWDSALVPMITSRPGVADEHSVFVSAEGASSAHFERTSVRRPGHKSALKGYGALELLREELGVTSLVMCGLSTSGCVLSTATHATEEDFVVTVVGDGCWDPKPEVHAALTESVLLSSCWVVGKDEGVKILSREGK